MLSATKKNLATVSHATTCLTHTSQVRNRILLLALHSNHPRILQSLSRSQDQMRSPAAMRQLHPVRVRLREPSRTRQSPEGQPSSNKRAVGGPAFQVGVRYPAHTT